ncbi:sulfate transporter subunit, partial [Roseomonas sp. DSM 102946]|nr:sulfate transporter subunit [Roseomonas sp. DSM 102946]
MAATPLLAARRASAQQVPPLLNVSYDPTRELYRDFNAAFAAQWAKDHGGQSVQ